MRHRILLVLVLALVPAVVVPAATGAPGDKTRQLDSTIRMAVIGQSDGAMIFAGEARGRPVRRSALILRSTAEGNQATGRGVLYGRRGTVRVTTENEIQPQADGSVRFPGTFRITGGTRRYKGARGSGEFDAVLPAGGTVYTVEAEGTIRY